MSIIGIIDNRSGGTAFRKLIETLCVCILGIILVAGLWPFRAPRNRAKWVENKDGIQFIPNSGVRSAAAFHPQSPEVNTSESIEIWLVPSSAHDTNTILSFDGSDHPGAPFLLRQYKDELIVRQPYIDGQGVPQAKWLAVGNAVSGGNPVFVTVTMGARDTSIYLDGVLSESFTKRGKSTNNLTGRLVVGDGPQGRGGWTGQVRGLAMYGSQLTPSEVAEHYARWTKSLQPISRVGENPIALYLFNEHKGDLVLNQLDPTKNLVIPERYFALHPAFLSSVMSDYQPTWEYWQDIGVNIAGFVPYGFFFALLWSELHVIKHPSVTTVFVGLLISLTIEVLQVFLPTRSSGSTDLITNTLGGAIGVVIYRSELVPSVLLRVRQRFDRNTDPTAVVQSGAADVSSEVIEPSEEPASISV